LTVSTKPLGPPSQHPDPKSFAKEAQRELTQPIYKGLEAELEFAAKEVKELKAVLDEQASLSARGAPASPETPKPKPA